MLVLKARQCVKLCTSNKIKCWYFVKAVSTAVVVASSDPPQEGATGFRLPLHDFLYTQHILIPSFLYSLPLLSLTICIFVSIPPFLYSYFHSSLQFHVFPFSFLPFPVLWFPFLAIPDQMKLKENRVATLPRFATLPNLIEWLTNNRSDLFKQDSHH